MEVRAAAGGFRVPHLPHKYSTSNPFSITPRFQPKVKDRVGNENNWIHVETAAAAAAAAAAPGAAADPGGATLPIETLRAMTLLEAPDSPRESYRSEQPAQVTCDV